MAKIPVKRIFICGLKKDRKHVLESIQMEGVVEIIRRDEEDEYLKAMDVMPQKLQFDKNSNVAEQALTVLERYAHEQKGLLDSFEDARELSREDYDRQTAHAEEYLCMADDILKLQKRIDEGREELPKIESRQEALRPWVSFDLPLDPGDTAYTTTFTGTVDREISEQEVLEAIEESAGEAIPAEVSVVSASKEMSCLFIICLKKDRQAVAEALKILDFSAPKSRSSALVPSEELRRLESQRQELLRDMDEKRAAIAAYAARRDDLKFASDYYAMRAEKYSVLAGLPQSGSAFFIEGYVPEALGEALCRRLTERYDVACELMEPGPDEDVPVILRNGVLSEPVEAVVESYSMPGKGEIDPTRITSIFYYIFFGMMLSDAGYGLLLTFGTALILMKVRNMKPGTRKMMKLFFYGGISTIFWGLMFGSFFGNSVNVIATTFFGRPDISLKPLWLDPMSEPMRYLVFAFACGIVHIFTGLAIKLYQCIRQKDYMSAFCDAVLWFMFVGGGIVYLLSMPMITGMMGLSFTVGATPAAIAGAVAVAGCIGVVLTGGRESKNWFKRILKGLYAAYGVTSYLSDILSYSRLLALGLATGVIAQVFNQMGSMLGATWYGALIFILIFMIGHVLNIAINVLGAYVHTNRLQFVEFFGKFYDGGGKSFEPFTEKTRYFKVKEDK